MLSFAWEIASPFVNARFNSLHSGDAEAWNSRPPAESEINPDFCNWLSYLPLRSSRAFSTPGSLPASVFVAEASASGLRGLASRRVPLAVT